MTRDDIRDEVINVLPLKPHGRIIAAPRSGKTAIAIALIKLNKPKSILWVTPSADLAQIGIVEEFNKWKAKSYIKKLTTSTYTSLDKVTGHYEMIILDEEQFVTWNNVANLLNQTLTYDYIISMTGTKAKTLEKQEIYDALDLPILYELDINSAVDMGLLSNYVIKVVEVPLSNTRMVESGNQKKRFLTSEKKNYEYLDKLASSYNLFSDKKFRIINRMRAIYNSPSKEYVLKYLSQHLKGRKMYFCSSIEQADRICSHTYHSKTNNKDLLKFINGEIDEISMVNAGTVGFTYKAVDHLIINQVNSDNVGSTTQKICRALLKQHNYDATIWIICLKGTRDEMWVESTLRNFDKYRIEYLSYDRI